MIRKPLVVLMTALALSALPAAAAEHAHDHHGHGPAKLQLNQGKKWPTDEALRRNMAALGADFSARVHAIHKGRLSADEYAALGKGIEARVADIVAQCKLDPDADAMLHLVVADLLAAADVMQGKAPGKPAAAAHQAVTALNGYGRHFDHPGWRAIK